MVGRRPLGEVDLKLTAYANLVLVFSSLVYSQMKYRVKIDSPSGGVCIALLQSQVADKFSRMPAGSPTHSLTHSYVRSTQVFIVV